MPWAVNTPKGQVQLLDLPLSALEQIEVETDRRWSFLINSPMWTAKSMNVIYAAACRHLDCEPLELTPRVIAEQDIFCEVPEDLPTVFEEGLPKAEDEPSTSGSSGAPNDSGGPPT